MTMSMLSNWTHYGVMDGAFVSTSDPQGKFEFRVADSQKPFFVLVRAPGYAPVKLKEQAVHTSAPWNIPMTKGATLRGTMGSKPSSKDTQLDVVAGNLSFDSIQVHADGTFEAGDLPEGSVLVTARPGYHAQEILASATVNLSAGSTAEIDFSKVPKATLRCTVTLDGEARGGQHSAEGCSVKKATSPAALLPLKRDPTGPPPGQGFPACPSP